jgi:uncharacterized damage-inducible protein DinB
MANNLFEDLFTFNCEANNAFIEVMRTNPEAVPTKAMVLFCHVLNAQILWLDRLRGLPMSLTDAWLTYDLDTCATLNETLTMQSLEYLQSIADPLQYVRPFGYTNLAGETHASLLRDVLIHVTNHGTYHRGQVALLLKEAGFQPPRTDYVYMQRLTK